MKYLINSRILEARKGYIPVLMDPGLEGLKILEFRKETGRVFLSIEFIGIKIFANGFVRIVSNVATKVCLKLMFKKNGTERIIFLTCFYY